MLEISKAVIQKDGKYLLLKRASNALSFPGLRDFTGWKDDPGETHTQSVMREVKEETSYDIIPWDEMKRAEYHDKKYDLSFHYFIPASVRGEIRLSDEHSDLLRATLEEIKNLELHPSVPLFFDL